MTAPWMMLNAFLQIAAKYPWEERRAGVFGSDVIVRHEAVGVVGAIVPWNVPQYVTVAKLAPALLAGCTIVIKPSPETPLDALFLAQMLEEAGLPKGVVSVVPAGREVSEHLVRHPAVDKIAFTGSTLAGRRIASICGEQLKRFSLELGGKSAAIVLDDADLDMTIQGLKYASIMNNGQTCVAQTRILAGRKRYDEVVDALATMVGGLTVGDPTDPATDVGPLAAHRQQGQVEKYIALGQEEGAQIVVGQALGHLVHQLDLAQLLAKHVELDQNKVFLLGAERGDVLVRGLPLLAMARQTGRQPFLEGRRRGGERGRDRDGRQNCAHRVLRGKTRPRVKEKSRRRMRPRPWLS